ncbi:MAG TPA: tetratricopeptide repeat protein [Candidatus Paceibacterota bacterium]|nr:tetratricopeptide repeat protein [Verrucomicrobiota bacterium]HSA09726.1 tetratricopeptide repeat protein [Candidatus Paceibacterota bacterium]
MKWFSVILVLLLGLAGARAAGADDQYVHLYNLIQEADKLKNAGQSSEALSKYVEAQAALQRIQKGYPNWNTKVVTFRMNYVTDQIAALSAQSPAAATPAAPAQSAKAPGAPPGIGSTQPAQPTPADGQTQLDTLKDQIRQAQADKAVAEAKLKEALSVQPAAVDPRELAKAEDKVKELMKENDLLKVSLEQVKTKAAPVPDTKALDEARQALAEANRSLAEKTKAADALAAEKTLLQEKLNSLTPSPANAAELEAAKKALETANLKLAEQSKLASDLASDKETLQARMKALSTEAEAAAALRAENQLLKQQVADLKAAPPPSSKAEEASRQLAQAQAQIAALQSDKEMLQLEKTALENRVKQTSAQPASPAPSRAADAARIKQLEQERDELKKSLDSANKELYSRKGKAAAARLRELEDQLTTLRARLQVYEARQVPYTAEELALFKQPEIKLAQPTRSAGKVPARELPPGTVALAAEAQRHYANRQFDQAEEKYLQVLQQDNKNVPALANLAAIELDLGHLEAAEINIKQAVALAPEDAYSQFVLGRLRFRQKQYDEAVDALGLAAKYDPQDAQVQNFLGLALSEKGLRGPAETALRKAIQLDPNYAGAHHNLAVEYISQKPPMVELARWHYQKALDNGHPRNPDLEKIIEAAKPAAATP